MKTTLKRLGLFAGYVATVLVIGGCQSSQLACCTPDGSATASSSVQGVANANGSKNWEATAPQ